MALHEYMKRVVEQREVLSRSQARALLDLVLVGSTEAGEPGSPHSLQLAALLGAIAARGETASELAGFAEAMLAAAVPVPLDEAERSLLVDTCGTGGDDTGTFNISTAAALVAAASAAAGAGMMVAKHGNRAVTSLCGSADVLEALGIPISLTPAAGAASLRRHRFAFLHAPGLHPAMKAVMPVRRALGVRTAFNVLGPLANPAGARAQVMGVYSARLVPIVAEAMRLLGVRHAFVVHGAVAAAASGSGIDEISISGPTQIAEVRGDAVTFSRLTPDQVGMASAPISSLRGGDVATNAAILRAIFAGEPGPRRDVVLLNAAAVLIAADVVPSSTPQSHQAFRDAIALAARAIDSGAVTALVATLATEGAAERFAVGNRTEP
jgi:anthranilate phosphoribosyltransferase